MTQGTHRTPDRSAQGQGDTGPRWWTFVRNALLVAVVVGMVWLALNVDLPTPAQLQRDIDELGSAGWLVFVVLVALVAITPIPLTIMAVAAGLLFDTVTGSLLAVVGAVVGCLGAYGLARALGRDLVVRLLGSWAERIERQLDHSGHLAILTLRLMPGVPFWPVNYGSGAFGVPLRTYLPATVVAAVPGQVSLVAIGSFVASPSPWRAAVVVVAWVVVLAMTVWSLRRWRATAQS